LNQMTNNYRREVNNNIALAERHHQLQVECDALLRKQGLAGLAEVQAAQEEGAAEVHRWTDEQLEERLEKERVLVSAEKEALESQLAEYSAVVQEEERVIEDLRQALAAEETERQRLTRALESATYQARADKQESLIVRLGDAELEREVAQLTSASFDEASAIGVVRGLLARLKAEEAERLKTEEQGAVMLDLNGQTIRNLEMKNKELEAKLRYNARNQEMQGMPDSRQYEAFSGRSYDASPPRATMPTLPSRSPEGSQSSQERPNALPPTQHHPVQTSPRQKTSNTELKQLKEEMMRTINSLQTSLHE